MKKRTWFLMALLVHRLEDHVSGAVGGVAGAAHRSLAVVARVPTKATLVNAPVGGAVERQAAMLKFIDGVNGLAGQNLRRGSGR